MYKTKQTDLIYFASLLEIYDETFKKGWLLNIANIKEIHCINLSGAVALSLYENIRVLFIKNSSYPCCGKSQTRGD